MCNIASSFPLSIHLTAAAHNETHIVKFADDTCVICLISKDGEETGYRSEISTFTNWCNENKLILNVSKTKDLIVDVQCTSRGNWSPASIELNGELVEQVQSYKHLGLTITNKLRWDAHIHTILSKVDQRMFLLRKLDTFRLEPTLISLFYKATIETLLTFCLSAWCGNATAYNMNKLNRVIMKARKVCRSQVLSSVEELL